MIAPNFGDLNARLDGMSHDVDAAPLSSFKTYTGWGPGGQGYRLDDPAIGLPVLDHAQKLGVKVFCAHKGLRLQGLNESYNHPDDLVAAAKQFPDLHFVVYHSAFETETVEGAYDPDARRSGSTPCSRRSTTTRSRPTPTSGASWARRGEP